MDSTMDDIERNGQVMIKSGSSESTTFSSSDFSDSFDIDDGIDEQQDVPLSNLIDVYKDVNSLVSSKQMKKTVGLSGNKSNDKGIGKRKIKFKTKRLPQQQSNVPEKHRKTTSISVTKKDKQKIISKEVEQSAQDELREHGLGVDGQCFNDTWKSKDETHDQSVSSEHTSLSKKSQTSNKLFRRQNSKTSDAPSYKIVNGRRVFQTKKKEPLLKEGDVVDRYATSNTLINQEDSFRDDESDKRSEAAVEKRQSDANTGVVVPAESDKYAIGKEGALSADATAFTLFHRAKTSIIEEKWSILLHIINTTPKILSYKSESDRGQTLLHFASGKKSVVPEFVGVQMINLYPDAVSFVDNDGCIPLHHAASSNGQTALTILLIESWSEGLKIPNVDGDLPLHVAVWGGNGNEESSLRVCQAYPEALQVKNKSGALPLHLACCKPNASPKIVKRMLQLHDLMGLPIDVMDVNGNSPLHIAIKTKASSEVIRVLSTDWDDTDLFSLPDGKNIYPLHISLSLDTVDASVVRIVSNAAPHIRGVPFKQGIKVMPARIAAERKLPDIIVKDLLLTDMPIDLQGSNSNMTSVPYQRHYFSWWYVATAGDIYASIIDEILSKLKSVPEIIALAQLPDPSGSSTVFAQAHESIRFLFQKNLRFCERYELVALNKIKVVDGMLILRALDHGHGVGWDEMSNKISAPRPLDSGFIAVSYDHTTSEKVEVVFISHPEREVLLHCCAEKSGEPLLNEINIRKQFNFSPTLCQRLYNNHYVDGSRIGCKGKVICVAFERPLATLSGVFETSRFRKRKNEEWQRKSRSLLKRLAKVLKYLHESGFVHGHLEASTIAKFRGEHNWKIMDLGKITPMGQRMGGPLRSCVPPESISRSSGNESQRLIELKKIVSFDKNLVTSNSDEEQDKGQTDTNLTFSPHKCLASTSWDVWSFGLVMGQLILGQSMVVLPNFEVATDAHMKNLYQHNDENLLRIELVTRKKCGEAASVLLRKLLEPSPENRPKSMDEILSHSYFLRGES